MYFACGRSGQPSVWITRSSGCSTSQTSLTPSAQTCGSVPARPSPFSAAPVRWPQQPSASTVARATTSEPGSKFDFCAALLVAALVARAHADHGLVVDQQLRADGLRQHVGAGLLGALAQPAVELGDRDDVVAVVAERRRRRLQRQRALAVEHEVDGLATDLAEVRPGVVVRRTAAGSAPGSSRRPRAGARRRRGPSRSPRPAPRRATRPAPGRPRAAAAGGSRRPSPPGRRRRSRRRPRSARPRRSVGGPMNSAAASTGGGNSIGATALPLRSISRSCAPSRPR